MSILLPMPSPAQSAAMAVRPVPASDEVVNALRAAVAAAESVEKAATAAAAAARQALNEYLLNGGAGARKRKRKRPLADGAVGVLDHLGNDPLGPKVRISYAARKWYDFNDVCRLGEMIDSGEVREGQLHEKDDEQKPRFKVPYSSMKFWLKDDFEVMRARGGGGVKGMRHWRAERDLRGRTHLTPPGFAPGSRPTAALDKAKPSTPSEPVVVATVERLENLTGGGLATMGSTAAMGSSCMGSSAVMGSGAAIGSHMEPSSTMRSCAAMGGSCAAMGSPAMESPAMGSCAAMGSPAMGSCAAMGSPAMGSSLLSSGADRAGMASVPITSADRGGMASILCAGSMGGIGTSAFSPPDVPSSQGGVPFGCVEVSWRD